MVEFYGFTRKNNSSVVITIPSKLNIGPDTQVRVSIEIVGDNRYRKNVFIDETMKPQVLPLVSTVKIGDI